MNRISLSSQIRVGYVPLLDAAPLIAAQELGIAKRHGLRMKLVRQLGWATVRDHLIFGDLDAAHAPAGLMLALNAGHGAVPVECITGFIFNEQGNAITLSSRLFRDGIRDINDLGDYAKHRRGDHVLTFAVVSRYSTHSHLLRHWLAQGGIHADKEARIVILPPSQMQRCLSAGHIDGFCVGEPWNAVSIATGDGWIAAHGAGLAPSHPEKVLMVHRAFANDRASEHGALIASLCEASDWCADAANRRELARLLHLNAFPSLPAALLVQSLASPDAPIFHGEDLHRPAPAKAAWLVNEMLHHGLLSQASVAESLASAAFSSDIYDQALSAPKTLALQA